MKHPFAATAELSALKELNEQETQQVGGGLSFPPPTVTTLALGEEGGLPVCPPTMTTMAVGEEGGSPIKGPIFTTLAIGEEGGSGRLTF